MKKDKKINETPKVRYKLGDSAGIRITELSGATEEVIDFFNYLHTNDFNFSAEIIECVKLRLDLEKNYSKSQIEKLRKGKELNFEGDEVNNIDKVSASNKQEPIKNENVITKENDKSEIYTKSSEETSNLYDDLFEDKGPKDIERSQELNQESVHNRDMMPGMRAANSLRKLKPNS